MTLSLAPSSGARAYSAVVAYGYEGRTPRLPVSEIRLDIASSFADNKRLMSRIQIQPETILLLGLDLGLWLWPGA